MKSFGAKVRMTHQIDVLRPQKYNRLSRCVRARIVVVKSDPSSAVGFPDFLEDNVQFFRKNRISFAWKRFVRDQLFLDLAHLETFI